MSVMAAVQGADTNQLNIMQSFSQSTQSLPSVSSKIRDNIPTVTNLKRFQSIAEFTNEKRKIVHKLSKTDMDSIENVCKFINNNSEPNLTELPGLKIKQNLPAPSRPNFQSALQLKIIIHEDKVLKTSLKSKEMTIQSLTTSIFTKLDISTDDRKDFCLCKKVGEEYFFLPCLEKVVDQNTNVFFLRITKSLNASLRRKLFDSKFDVRNCGNFAYKGRLNKRPDSAGVSLVVNSSGLEVNCDFILWKYVHQVSYSQTFIQILYKQNNGIAKKKICFDNQNIKNIYNLVLHFLEMEKLKKETAVTSIECRGESKPRDDEGKFENFCKKICNITKDAVKSIGTPRRKRSKSIDSHSLQKPKKNQSFNRSLSSTDMHRVKRNIMEEFQETKQSNLSASNKRRSETQMENLPKRTKIVTNPRISDKEIPASSQAKKAPGRTPVRMGVKSVTCKSVHPNPERKIFYTTALKSDFQFFAVTLKVLQSALYVESVGKAEANCKFVGGDRILAINGISLENCTMEKADYLLEHSGNFVNFIISRKLS